MTITNKLALGIGVLALVQLVHLVDVLRYADDASFPGVLNDPQAIIGVGLCALACVLNLLGHRAARTWTIAAAGTVTIGFLLHHGIPADLGGVNNPYWTADEGNRADWFRWLTVVVIVGLGAWTLRTAWRASVPRLRARSA